VVLAGPIRRSRFGGIEGRQASRGGDSPQGFPLECKRQRAAPQARRREGLKPNGRDGLPAWGAARKARRRLQRRHAILCLRLHGLRAVHR